MSYFSELPAKPKAKHRASGAGKAVQTAIAAREAFLKKYPLETIKRGEKTGVQLIREHRDGRL